MEGEIKPYHEKWKDFGDNIEGFINSNKDELSEKSFDIILGFTRGGYIIALMLSTLLRDIIKEVYDVKEKPHKASVRPIPPGITTKRYRDPCFVMQDSASKEDMDDLRDVLYSDLIKFKRKIEKESNEIIKKINVLLVDDNLTGSTRLMAFAKDMRTWDFLNVNTLCYVRHFAFKRPEIKSIREFPEGFDYFVMPWHLEEKPKDIIEDKPKQIFIMRFKKSIEFDLNRFNNRVKDASPSYDFIPSYPEENVYTFSRGETNILMEIKEETISFRYYYNKIYPPKKCLLRQEPGFQPMSGKRSAFSFCEEDENLILHTNSCIPCAFLNCNGDFFFNLIFENAGVREIIIHPMLNRHPENEEQLIQLIKKWFQRNYPSLEVKSSANTF